MTVNTYHLSPMWKVAPLIIENHDLEVLKAVFVQGRSEVGLDKVALHLGCEAHALKAVVMHEARGRLVLRRHAPEAHVALAVFLNKPGKEASCQLMKV